MGGADSGSSSNHEVVTPKVMPHNPFTTLISYQAVTSKCTEALPRNMTQFLYIITIMLNCFVQSWNKNWPNSCHVLPSFHTLHNDVIHKFCFANAILWLTKNNATQMGPRGNIASMISRLVWGQAFMWCRKIKHLPARLNVVQTNNISLNMFLYTYKLAWHTHTQFPPCPRKSRHGLAGAEITWCHYRPLSHLWNDAIKFHLPSWCVTEIT
jgi:hypothetical protein